MQKQIEGERGRTRRALALAQLWLRRVMPRVAIVTGLLFVSWLSFGDYRFVRETFVGWLFRFVVFWAVFLTCVYYGLKALRWLKRKLLWRVRRRLVITYLFVGLTPIILMTILGLLSAFGGSGQGMARIIASQVNATEKQTQKGARNLAEAFARLPPNMDDRSVQAWLDERAALLRGSLPGARLALWRGAAGDDATSIGHKGSAQFISLIDEENVRGVGNDTAPVGYRLPEWLRGRAEWSGLTYSLPSNPEENFGSPSVRGVARGLAGNRPFALLIIVPVSRALVQQYRETTGIYVRPFFVQGGVDVIEGSRARIRRDGNVSLPGASEQDEDPELPIEVDSVFSRDQFGEKVGESFYVVVLPATDWMSGETSENLSFIFDWSWALASKQFWGHGQAGELWRRALMYVAIAFLILELLALAASAWMTRAVTGTVHKLYRAVEFIKRGDFSHRVHVRSHDQLGELAAAFNDMSANIEVLLEERVERERLEREVEIAAEVQAQLFPRRVPELRTAEISAECRAARGVAGDYYDYIEVAPGLVALALGDVSGKGVSASLVMSNLQASLRAQTTITAERMKTAERAMAASAEAGGGGDGGSQLLTHVVAAAEIDGAVARKMKNINHQICQSTESNRFATLFLALYEDRTRRLRYTNAGHNAPVLVRTDGTVERLTTGGMMVGAFEWAEYEEAAVTLMPDDLLLIFSDGICEAENEAAEEYGEEKLAQFAVAHRDLSADELRQAIFDEIDAWSGTRERGDDQTLVIMKSGV
jgi:sigma-B regulation protein RsbU (phosphoserine phosphatase)